MKLISLNVRHGGGRRLTAIAAWLEAQQPDMIVLTEWRGGRALLNGLFNGLVEAHEQTRQNGKNGLVVAAATPFRSSSLTPPSAIDGEIALVDGQAGFKILCAYFPQGRAKKEFFEVCHGFFHAHEDEPILLVGDLNTGNNRRDVEADGAKFTHAELFDELSATLGMIDLWRRCCGAETPEWSWRSSKNGFRIDHAFGNAELLKQYDVQCRYDHSTRADTLTDHSALILNISRQNSLRSACAAR